MNSVNLLNLDFMQFYEFILLFQKTKYVGIRHVILKCYTLLSVEMAVISIIKLSQYYLQCY